MSKKLTPVDFKFTYRYSNAHLKNKTYVTDSNAFDGARVIRSDQWRWSDQDRYKGNKGTVKRVRPEKGWVRVKWDVIDNDSPSGYYENSYRIGAEDAYDLYLANDEVNRKFLPINFEIELKINK